MRITKKSFEIQYFWELIKSWKSPESKIDIAFLLNSTLPYFQTKIKFMMSTVTRSYGVFDGSHTIWKKLKWKFSNFSISGNSVPYLLQHLRIDTHV